MESLGGFLSSISTEDDVSERIHECLSLWKGALDSLACSSYESSESHELATLVPLSPHMDLYWILLPGIGISYVPMPLSMAHHFISSSSLSYLIHVNPSNLLVYYSQMHLTIGSGYKCFQRTTASS